ncbi:hypothetical protein IAD21_03245 [Abditibacteriota bacterium]|nr:hypothetical protein IAD21_03245 [Abditibacteriota bacterium]
MMGVEYGQKSHIKDTLEQQGSGWGNVTSLPRGL